MVRSVQRRQQADPSVQRHLLHVASALRAAGEPGVRDDLLDALEAYARAGRFPTWAHPIPGRRRVPRSRRFRASGRRAPRFRDAGGVWCAVGYLMSLTDPELAQSLAERFEDRWLSEMNDPRIRTWAERHGFELDELAWIQPDYCWQPPLCDEIELIEATPPDDTSCDGPDARPKPIGWDAFCQDGCDGPFRVWVEVVNRGTQVATGVTVELWGGEPAQTLDSELIDVPSGASMLVELQTHSVVDVGTLGGITVNDPEGCMGATSSLTLWDTGNGGLGWVLPDVCGGTCDTGGDTGVPREERQADSCGCTSAPAGLAWMALGGVAFARRRPGSRRSCGGGAA